jgi:hypothetical protein
MCVCVCVLKYTLTLSHPCAVHVHALSTHSRTCQRMHKRTNARAHTTRTRTHTHARTHAQHLERKNTHAQATTSLSQISNSHSVVCVLWISLECEFARASSALQIEPARQYQKEEENNRGISASIPHNQEDNADRVRTCECGCRGMSRLGQLPSWS